MSLVKRILMLLKGCIDTMSSSTKTPSVSGTPVWRVTIWFEDKDVRPSNIFIEAQSEDSAREKALQYFEEKMDEYNVPDGTAFGIEVWKSSHDEARIYGDYSEMRLTSHFMVN